MIRSPPRVHYVVPTKERSAGELGTGPTVRQLRTNKAVHLSSWMQEEELRADYSTIRGRIRALFPRASADDVVQESYAQAIAYAQRVPDRIRRPAGLIWTIAKRQALRSAFAMHNLSDGLAGPQLSSSTVAPWEAANANLNHRTLHYAVTNLPHGYRDVVHRYYFQSQSCREIAADLNLSTTAVRTRLRRARAKLRIALGGLDDTGE
jgi:RNA polymerase sigma factor (sigma-70 family)